MCFICQNILVVVRPLWQCQDFRFFLRPPSPEITDTRLWWHTISQVEKFRTKPVMCNALLQTFILQHHHRDQQTHPTQNCLLSRYDMWEVSKHDMWEFGYRQLSSIDCQFPRWEQAADPLFSVAGVNASLPDLTPHYTCVLLLHVSIQLGSEN